VPWAPDYITAEEAAAFVRTTDAAELATMGTWVTAASRAIDTRCNRQFGQLAAPATFTYDQAPVYSPTTGAWFLEIDDVQDPSGLLIDGVSLASSGADLWPRNAVAKGKAYTHLRWDTSWSSWTDPIEVTATFGWTAVPQQVIAAAGLQVSRFVARRDSPYGIAGSSSEGAQLRLLARLDPDVSVSLAGLSRPRRMG
jgi:hypothetical protein